MSTIHVRVQTIEDKIESYIENNGVEIYVDYNDGLSEDQITMLLEKGRDEVICDVEEWANSNSFSDEFESYWEQLRDEVGCTQDDIDDYLNNGGVWPSYYLDEHSWKQLLRNTSAYITCTMWDVNWNFNDWAYGGTLEYNDVKEALKILGVNPKEFRDHAAKGAYAVKGYFPNMPKREAKVDYKDLLDNMCVLYDGVMNFCLGDLENIAEVLSTDSEYITFKKGTNVVMYDFGGGAGITEVELTGDVTVKRKDVEFRNDDAIKSYYGKSGIQECYGFDHNYWTSGSIQ